jgi:hypothetical protein
MDDQPHLVQMPRRPAHPHALSQELNDIPRSPARKENGADFADMIVDQFDER